MTPFFVKTNQISLLLFLFSILILSPHDAETITKSNIYFWIFKTKKIDYMGASLAC